MNNDPAASSTSDSGAETTASTGITRRDFLQGAALTAALGSAGALETSAAANAVSASAAQALAQHRPGYYPPALTGLRGSHVGSFEVAHAVRDANGWNGSSAHDTSEHYDLAVVGGGLSGLAAAYEYRKNHPNARILVLDNHDDIGGHAKRNEFSLDGRTLIGYGGTQSIFTQYPPEVISLLSELGIELRRFKKYYDHDFRSRYGLLNGVFFDKETFGRDHLARGHVELPFDDAFAGAPLSAQARRDLKRLFTERIDYLAGRRLQEKHALLASISFDEFLLQHAKVHPDVLPYYYSSCSAISGVGTDASSALVVIAEGTWFETYPQFLQPMWNLAEGMALGFTPWDAYGYICHFPDGNASIARALARALVPAALAGKTMEDIVTARMDYAALDGAASPVRIRLNSTVVRVQHVGNPASANAVDVTYVTAGKPYKVRAANVVMACYNMMIPRLCPELPEQQAEALRYPVKVPLVFTNVLLRNWRSLAKLGVADFYCPGSFYYSVSMDFPVSMGAYQYTRSPDDPVILHLVTHIPSTRGLPPREQRRIARAYLYATPFETFEQKIREQLGSMLGPGGFDADRDIAGITVNRWPHGYADPLDGLDDPQWPAGGAPNIVGRQKFGRIAIANSDAGAEATSGAAIEEALRAARELG